jgi:hypothetical protein
MMVQNLDAACAELGAKLGASGNKDTENSITNALGVLEEQGLYARERAGSSSLRSSNSWRSAASFGTGSSSIRS